MNVKNGNYLATTAQDIKEIWRAGLFFDMGIMAGEEIFHCHKSHIYSKILSLQKLVKDAKYHQVIPVDADPLIMKYILEFIYVGEVNVPESLINTFLSQAEKLGVKDLATKHIRSEAPQQRHNFCQQQEPSTVEQPSLETEDTAMEQVALPSHHFKAAASSPADMETSVSPTLISQGQVPSNDGYISTEV